MEQFIVRMVREKEDLEGKLKRANNALLKSEEIRLDKVQVALLEEQTEYMKKYLDVLNNRIAYEKKLHGVTNGIYHFVGDCRHCICLLCYSPCRWFCMAYI